MEKLNKMYNVPIESTWLALLEITNERTKESLEGESTEIKFGCLTC